MTRSTGSNWMRAFRLHEKTREEGLAVARARRLYADKARMTGLSDPAGEQMRGYSDSPAGRTSPLDLGSMT